MNAVSYEFRAVRAEIRGFLLHRTGDSAVADDLLQDVFLRALQQEKAFSALENPRAWLFQVARNLLLDRLRLSKDQVPLPDDLCVEMPGFAPVELLSQCLPRVLSELSMPDRDAIELCDIQGMTQQQYAEQRGLSLPAAKSRVQRARLRLHAQMAEACQVVFDDEGKVCCFVPRPPLDSAASE